MKAAVLGVAMFAAVAVPGGVKVGEVMLGDEVASAISICGKAANTSLLEQRLDVPVTAAMVPGVGKVEITRRVHAGCYCRSGKLACGVRHATVAADNGTPPERFANGEPAAMDGSAIAQR